MTFNSLLTDAVTNNNIKNSSSEASSNVEGNVNPHAQVSSSTIFYCVNLFSLHA